MTQRGTTVLEPATDAIPILDPAVHRRRWAILAVLALSLIIISLDNTVLNVALPSMQRSLKASSNDLQWIIDAYTLVFAGLVLLGGNLGDRYGRKGCLQIGLLLLAGGSTLVVLSDTTSTVIVARAIMGVGGALIMPATLSITSTVFVGAERAKAIAVWAACAAVGVALGPVLGGWLVEHYWWGSVFLVNIPIVVTALIAGTVLIPASKDPAVGPPDLAGAALSTIGITALVYAIIAASNDGWSSASVVGSFATSIVILGAFIGVELRIAHPMLPMNFFRSGRFSAACLAIAFTFFALLGAMYFLTQYFQVVRGYTSLQAGARMLPLAAGLAVAAPRGAALAEHLGTKRVVAAGMVLNGCGLGLFALIRIDTGYPMVALSLILMGLGMGATMAPATESVMGAVPAAQAGVGSAVNDAVRQLGSTLGIAVLGTVLATRYSAELTPKLGSLGSISEAVKKEMLDSIAGGHTAANSLLHPALIRGAADSAFVSAMAVTALIAAGAALAGAGVVAVFLPSREGAAAVRSLHAAPKRGRHVARHRAAARSHQPNRRHVRVADLSGHTAPHGKDSFLGVVLAHESSHSL